MYIRKTKINMVIMLPFNEGEKLLKFHKAKPLSEKVQKFYSRPCFEVNEIQDSYLSEIIELLKVASQREG